MADSLICPRTYDEFYRLMKQSELYGDAEINMLYEANQNLKKPNYIGGTVVCKHGGSQHGGLECLTLHTIYKYSLGILLAIGGIYCGLYRRPAVMEAILTFLEMVRTAFDAENFKHIWDIVGKTQLGFGFMERVTKYILEVFQKPSEAITMTWLKNLFELFCKVENGDKIDSVKKSMTKIVEKAIKEMFLEIPPEMQPHIAMPQLQMSASPLQQQQQQQPSTNHIVYNGKIINIEMGDAMITISPNIFKSRRARSSASSVYHTPPHGGVKTRRKKNEKKRRS
jgi:hypothetical protein